MKKVYPDAKAALDGHRQGRHDGHGRRVRPVRHAGDLDQGAARFRREEPDLRVEQCRHRRRGPRPAARDPADQEDDRVLCGREQAVRAAVSSPASWRSSSTRRARWPSASARAAPASRRSSPRPAPAPTSPRARKSAIFDGERYIMETGLVADLSLVHAWKGDTEGNLVYRKTARNFNPDDGDRRPHHGRRSRASGRAGRARRRPHHHAGRLRAAHHSHRPPRSASSSAPCASA